MLLGGQAGKCLIYSGAVQSSVCYHHLLLTWYSLRARSGMHALGYLQVIFFPFLLA